ncbi:hypothetical protein [Erythrobacter sp.]|uniref:hypothetical protein n=1 Tax=Erythrobacter sp. TaxID=1042 RepID=UPI0025E00140|nr:hypothetical protein [Erythrobacter sp.]
MSSLTDVEKRYLEKVLAMGKGYVLDYSDPKFASFFRGFGVDIHGNRYQTYGSSKANKMRSFWEQEPDVLVGRVLGEMLDGFEADCSLNNRELETVALEKAREIVARLSGVPARAKPVQTEDDFLARDFAMPSIQKLPIEGQVVPVIESRLAEARIAMGAGAYLSTIFLCGSVLEAVLLGAAQRAPASFNRALASPKASDGTVKRLHDWNLAQLIDVACEVDLLKPDVKKFSHGLRDFRNYIHPFEQMLSGFTPDEHTAKVCLQVLKAALASVAGERK